MIRLKIKEVAAQKNVSQRQLSIRTGIDLNHMRRILRNPYLNISMETLDKIAKVLQVDASELIESVPDKAPGETEDK